MYIDIQNKNCCSKLMRLKAMMLSRDYHNDFQCISILSNDISQGTSYNSSGQCLRIFFRFGRGEATNQSAAVNVEEYGSR